MRDPSSFSHDEGISNGEGCKSFHPFKRGTSFTLSRGEGGGPKMVRTSNVYVLLPTISARCS